MWWAEQRLPKDIHILIPTASEYIIHSTGEFWWQVNLRLLIIWTAVGRIPWVILNAACNHRVLTCKGGKTKSPSQGAMRRCYTEAVKIGQGHNLNIRGAPQKLEKYRKQFSPTVPWTLAEPPTFGQRPSDNSFGLWLPEVKKPVGSWLFITWGRRVLGNQYIGEPTVSKTNKSWERAFFHGDGAFQFHLKTTKQQRKCVSFIRKL